MSKKISTIKEYLEYRIADLQDSCTEYTNKRDWVQLSRTEARINELIRTLAEWQSQQQQILEAVGITQERINEHVGYTERDVVKIYIKSIEGQGRYHTAADVQYIQEIIREYEPTEKDRESSTEEAAGTSS